MGFNIKVGDKNETLVELNSPDKGSQMMSLGSGSKSDSEQMAAYIQAADEFLKEYPQFSKQQQVLDHFVERLSKKINTLQTLQTSNDIAMKQMQLSQHLSFSLLDRFKEAQQVLIPAWRYHLEQSRESNSSKTIEQLDKSREDLIQNLKKSLQK